MKRFIVITDRSVWLVQQGETGTIYVEDRATFGSPFIADGRRFNGQVYDGELRPGSRLYFTNVFEDSLGRTNQVVMTGIINRVVAFEDEPLPEVPEGHIDITPSWEGIAQYASRGSALGDVAQQAGKQADRLVSLHSLGRINDDDIRAADVRTAERFK
jgi:hypothetical protein